MDCRYIDTFEKYRYRYGEVVNIDIDIDKAILKNIDIGIDIDNEIPKISISIKYRIDSNLAYRTGLGQSPKKCQFRLPPFLTESDIGQPLQSIVMFETDASKTVVDIINL